MSDLDKSYSKRKYRRKIPKVSRQYDRHHEEKKTFDKAKTMTVETDEMISEHEQLVDVLESPSKKDDKKEVKKQKRELKEYKKMCKACKDNSCKDCMIEKSIDMALEKGRGKDKKKRKSRGSSNGMDQSDIESIKDNMPGHLMQYSDKQKAMDHADSDGKANVFHHEPTDSYHVVTDGKGTNHLKTHASAKEFNQLSDTGGHIKIKELSSIKISKSEEIIMAKSIEQEIEEMGEKVEKSTVDHKQDLIKTIQELGPENLKSAMAELDEDQTVLIKGVLTDMVKGKKAASMDGDYSPNRKFAQVKDMGTEEETGSDDADEKLVKPSNKDIKHQGDESPEGKDGQVIKAKEIKEEKAKKKIGEAVDDIVDADMKDHEDVMHKEKKMEKSLDELRVLRDDVIKSYEDANLEFDDVLVKAEMKKRLLKEEDQVKMGGQDKGGKKDRADKSAPDEIKVGKDSSETADEAVAKVGKVAKSLTYGDPMANMRAFAGGRNHNFSVNGYYDEVLNKAKEEEKGETLEKSETDETKEEAKYDVNDVIEKGLDSTMCDVATEELQKAQIKGKFAKPSFNDEELISSLNLTDEEAKNILGE